MSARRHIPHIALGVGAVVALVSCGAASEGPAKETWRFAIEETQGSVQDAYARELERRIEAKDPGIDVKVYPYGSLGTSDDLTEQLRMGSLQFAMASPGHLGKTIPAVQVFLLHFVFSDDDEVNRRALSDPKLYALFEPLYREAGLKLLSLFPEGWMVWTTQAPVRRPEDFSGIKIRTMTSPLLLEAYEAYGASPQAMPYSEVYSALQLNMVDAQVNPVFAIEEMSFYEVTSHMVFPRHAPFIATLVSNPSFFDGLSPERQRLVSEVVSDLQPFAFELQQRYNAERLETIRERKPEMELIELSEEERTLFRERSLPVRDSFVELAGPDGRAALDVLIAAINDAKRASGDNSGVAQ
jgi:tripartite ATP-independent transporter DctP family solute receptor